jgi:Zn-dependent peptidase ImmA (M78 family)
MFHEFAHFMMHAPDTGVTANFHGVGRRTKKEVEADAFALCALIPRDRIECAHEMDGFTPEMIRERTRLLKLYDI